MKEELTLEFVFFLGEKSARLSEQKCFLPTNLRRSKKEESLQWWNRRIIRIFCANYWVLIQTYTLFATIVSLRRDTQKISIENSMWTNSPY